MAEVEISELAPDFDLPALIAGVKKRFRLSEQRGKKTIVLAFYPFNWETASTRQLKAYQAEREKFLERGAEVVGISVESIMNTTAWEREIGPFDFPLCSDFWPHGEVAEKYGVLRLEGADAGASERTTIVVDKAGKIVFRRTYGGEQVPEVLEVLDVLRRI
jgi:peroxiredoxin